MDVIFTDKELELLAYMHEHAKAFDQRGEFQVDQLAHALGWKECELTKTATFLVGYRLLQPIGYVSHDAGIPGPILGYYLKSEGENYMRHLERALEEKKLLIQGKQLTLETAKGILGTARDVLVQTAGALLGEALKGRIGP